MLNLFRSLISIIRLLLDGKLYINYRRVSRKQFPEETELLNNNGIYVDSIVEISLPNVELLLNNEFIIHNYKLSITNSSNIVEFLYDRATCIQNEKTLEEYRNKYPSKENNLIN
jgi:hypothetical protein